MNFQCGHTYGDEWIKIWLDHQPISFIRNSVEQGLHCPQCWDVNERLYGKGNMNHQNEWDLTEIVINMIAEAEERGYQECLTDHPPRERERV